MVGFIIIGNGNAVTYKEIFPYIKNNELWIGASKGIGGKFSFIVPNDYDNKFVYEENGVRLGQVNSACWFTNISHTKRNTSLDLYKKYSADEYPKYDNYDAIESKTAEIPMDYDGVIGVPITFLDKYCPTQFEIVGYVNTPFVNGKHIYKRILIRRKKNEEIVEYGKKFLIIGNGNAVTYKEIFLFIKENKIWFGNKSFSGGMDMLAGKNYVPNKCKHHKYDERGNLIINVMMCVWFTNVEHSRRNSPITLYKTYSADEYPKYDNYDAIEVSRVENIPMDYEGVMGVPISFLDKYCPAQFEIVGIMSGAKGETFTNGNDGRAKFYVNGKGVYARILIRRR